MSDKVITSLELIERYARDREDENWRFRSYVKGRLGLKDDELDSLVAETTDEVWSQIDCTTCANCCRTMQVVVDMVDIERLAARLHLKPSAFQRKYVTRSEFGDLCLSSQPCPFLNGNICSVYEDRPQSCRDFPYLHKEGFRHRTMMMLSNSGICPIVFNTVERLKRRLWHTHGSRRHGGGQRRR